MLRNLGMSKWTDVATAKVTLAALVIVATHLYFIKPNLTVKVL